MLVPASARAFFEEVGVDAHARDPALFSELGTRSTREELAVGRGGAHPLQGRGLGLDRPGRPAPASVVDPELRGRGYGKRGLADLCGLLLRSTPPCPCSYGPKTLRPSPYTRESACAGSVHTVLLSSASPFGDCPPLAAIHHESTCGGSALLRRRSSSCSLSAPWRCARRTGREADLAFLHGQGSELHPDGHHRRHRAHRTRRRVRVRVGPAGGGRRAGLRRGGARQACQAR